MVGFSNNSLLLFAVVVAMFFLMNPDRFVNAPDYSMVMPVKDNEENINVKVIRQNLEDIHVVRMKSTLKTGMSKHLKRKSSLMYSPDNFMYRMKKKSPPSRYSDPSFTFPKRDFNDSVYTLKDFGAFDINQYDYPSIVYPIPFNELFQNRNKHYVYFGEKNPIFPEFVKTGVVEDSSFSYSDCVIVTGCSSNHVLSTLNMILSAVLADVYAPIVFVDYGIDVEYYKPINEVFNALHSIYQSVSSSADVYYRKFNFANFPSWFNISNRDTRGGYSWKVVSLFDVLMESKRIVMWSDGGNLFNYDFVDVLERVYKYGAYSPHSAGTIGQWVHASSNQFLGAHKMARRILLRRNMCNGALLLFDYNHDEVMNSIVFPLIQCAYTQKCISPQGTSRKNHRQDQAIVSVLMQSVYVNESCHGAYKSSVFTHRDCEKFDTCKNTRSYVVDKIIRFFPNNLHLSFSDW